MSTSTFDSSEYVFNLNDVQANMLGLVVSIMQNYGVVPADVVAHYNNSMHYYESNALPDSGVVDDSFDICCEHTSPTEQSELDVNVDVNDVNVNDVECDKKKYVATRRAFRDAMSDGFKICPKYHMCIDNNCQCFHVLQDDLCPHAGRNNHCDVASCDKIVIKACRKGRRCHDSSCSFRH